MLSIIGKHALILIGDLDLATFENFAKLPKLIKTLPKFPLYMVL